MAQPRISRRAFVRVAASAAVAGATGPAVARLRRTKEPRHFVLYEIYEDGAAFDEHLASSHYLSFADAIEGEIEQRSISRLAFFSAMATSEENFR